MSTMTAVPTVKVERERDYTRIPLKVLDAILDQIDAKVNGQLEINFAMGGVASIFATHKKTYK